MDVAWATTRNPGALVVIDGYGHWGTAEDILSGWLTHRYPDLTMVVLIRADFEELGRRGWLSRVGIDCDKVWTVIEKAMRRAPCSRRTSR